jgi:hypothetical protein
MDVPYFAIYYNDVYEVDLPRGHRFPMDKYRIVREALHAKISDDTRERVDEGRERIRCGEMYIGEGGPPPHERVLFFRVFLIIFLYLPPDPKNSTSRHARSRRSWSRLTMPITSIGTSTGI